MHQGKLVFAQVMAHLPLSTFRRCVARHGGLVNRRVKESGGFPWRLDPRAHSNAVLESLSIVDITHQLRRVQHAPRLFSNSQQLPDHRLGVLGLLEPA